MFGRTKTQQSAAPAEPTVVKAGGKGRPTPSRKVAEARNRHPVVGAAQLRPGASKDEKKAARAAQRETMNLERLRSREAMVTGDDRYLPARDKGPARRFARDYVDARRGFGEYFMPVAVGVFALNLIPLLWVKQVSVLVLYAVVLSVALESFLLRRRLNKLALAKFGDKAAGVGGYGMMRSLQLRRTRLPRPQVKRGEFPS